LDVFLTWYFTRAIASLTKLSRDPVLVLAVIDAAIAAPRNNFEIGTRSTVLTKRLRIFPNLSNRIAPRAVKGRPPGG
jgi:hypothetical protein